MKTGDTWWQREFDSLEELADGISDLLGCPVTIEDAGHRLLAYSTHTPSTDPARIATIISRKVPEQVIGSLWQEGVMAKLAESMEPVRIPAIPAIGLGNRTAVAIRKNETLLGYIWVLEENRTLDEAGMHHLKLAAGAAVPKLLRHHTMRRKEQERRQDFFWQLLTENPKTDETVRDEAEKLGIVLPSYYAVAIVQSAPGMSDSLRRQLDEALPSVWRTRFVLDMSDRQERIWLLEAPDKQWTGTPELAADTDRLLQLLRDQYGLAGLVAGFSHATADYGLLGNGYREAQAVLRLKSHYPALAGSLLSYRELGFYRALPLLHEHNKQTGYSNPSLERLRAYDAVHNSSLVETLELFLAKDSNGKEAADALHIHANSLNYRLKRIAEIGGIDLTSMDQKVTLYLDLKTEQFIRRK